MDNSSKALLCVVNDYITGWPIKYPRRSDSESELPIGEVRDDDFLEETFGDYVATALYDLTMRHIWEILKIPGVQTAILAAMPNDYELNDNWRESIHDTVRMTACTAGDVLGDLCASYIFDQFEAEMEGLTESYKRVHLTEKRDEMFKAPIFRKFTKEQIDDYINEAEHQEGYEYWIQFSSISQLYRDVEMYYSYPDPEDE